MEKKINKKLKGAALMYAVIMSAVFAITGSALLMNNYSQAFIYESALRSQKLHTNALSGINLLLDENFSNGKQQILDLFGEETDSVKIFSRQWGAFQMVSSEAMFNGDEEHIIALTGTFNQNPTALYLADNDKPLSVCGSTRIKGKCFLPKAGIRRAYIEGKGFEGKEFVTGLIENSSKGLPRMNNGQIKKILASLDDNSEDSVIIVEKSALPDSLKNSFYKKTICFFSKEPLYLDNTYLSGNIMLVSEDSIVVSTETSLQDVILYAPSIHFKEKFTGSVQAFVSDSLQVDKDCILKYPSVLGIFNKTSSLNNQVSSVCLGENSALTGEIICLDPAQNNRQQIIIAINKNSIVKGNIYTTGSVDLKGSVFGSVYCNSFLLRTPSSTYENHLLDGEIDVAKRPKYYAGVALIEDRSDRVIVKWLE